MVVTVVVVLFMLVVLMVLTTAVAVFAITHETNSEYCRDVHIYFLPPVPWKLFPGSVECAPLCKSLVASL
jgi:hypothetical protein